MFAMEMYFAPAIVGGGLTLRCLSWDMEEASRVVFYKNNAIVLDSTSPTHRILSVAEADQGAYKCIASVDDMGVISDAQELFIHGPSIPPQKNGIKAFSVMVTTVCALFQWPE